MKPTLFWKLTLGMALSFALVNCSPQVESEQIGGNARNNGNTTGGNGTGSENGGGKSSKETNVNGTKEGREFFEGKVVAAFRDSGATCLGCHDAPRNLQNLPVDQRADEAIYDFGKMFSILKAGNFSNDNGFINPMLGKVPHPGAQICRNEEDPMCQLAIQWYNIEFPDGVASVGFVEKIELDAVDRHVIHGYAKDVNNPGVKLMVKAYIDGDKDAGTAVGEILADFNAGLDIGDYGYQLRIPANLLDSKEREVYVYAQLNGEEVELAGSPFKFLSLRQNPDAFPGLGGLGINANGCGCHVNPATEFSYNNLWIDLAKPSNPDAKIGPRNNKAWEFTQAGSTRATGHGGGTQGNEGAVVNWFCAEFNIDNQFPECP